MEAVDAGLASPPVWSLCDYDCARYGPLLGVSDEGSAATAILAAALESPKARALSSPTARQIGVAHDGERLGSIGETPIGPDEFAAIAEAVAERILITTNIGSHTASWHYLRGPTAELAAGASEASARLNIELAAHLPAGDSGPRRVPVYLDLPAHALFSRPGPLCDVIAEVRRGLVVPDGIEAELSLLVDVAPSDGAGAVEAAIDLAAHSQVATVAIGGVALAPAEGRTQRPGILNYFSADAAGELLTRASASEVDLRTIDVVDLESIANQTWAALATARRMGAAAGKYSLYPLTLHEMEPVLARVQGWFSDWTAAPTYYLDLETVDGRKIVGPEHAADGARRWLEIAAAAGARVVLIDTADKAMGRRLLKGGPDDERGILTLEEIGELDQLAGKLDARIVWAGGIGLDQVGEFGRLGCFGVYVTSAAARKQRISAAYADDPVLAVEREPTREGVATTKLQLEAGFLAERVEAGQKLVGQAHAALGDPAGEAELADSLIGAWLRYWGNEASDAGDT